MVKRNLKLFLVFMALLLIVGCSSNDISTALYDIGVGEEQFIQKDGFYDNTSSNSVAGGVLESDSMQRAPDIMPPSIPPTTDSGLYPTEENSPKVTTNVNMSIETTEFDNSIKSIETLIDKSKGFVAQSSVLSNGGYYGNRTHRTANYTIRVPKDNLSDFLSSSGVIGEIISQNTNRQDMSEYYYDTESRLEVLKVKEERILNLLEKAEKMEDIISLEHTLSSVIYEKESLTGSLRGIDDKVSYSTVFIDIREVERIVKPSTIETTFGEEISNTFDKSIANLKKTLQGLTLGLIYLLPGLIIAITISLVIVFIMNKKIKVFFRKREKRIEKEDEETKE